MDINFESSIMGLWIAPSREFGYLGNWFRRLADNSGQFVPLKPGLNVVYGRNGAGKTQLIQAISYVADFKMSAFEGFILKDPTIRKPLDEKVEVIFERTVEDILEGYLSDESEDMQLGWTPGFNPQNVSGEKKAIVFDILNEFKSHRQILLTRAPSQDEPSAGDPETMNAPEFVQFVPVIFPSNFAPLTRAHAVEIHKSYMQFIENVKSRFSEGDNPKLTVSENNERYSEEILQKGKLFDEWVESWSWSPLINIRNLGWNWDFSFVQNEVNAMLWDCENNPIFLPAIKIYSVDREYEEFSSAVRRKVSISLTRENEPPKLLNYFGSNHDGDALSIIGNDEIGYRNESRGNRGIDNPDLYNELISTYVDKLRQKLSFLPNFRSLEFHKSSKPNMNYLVINQRVLASEGSQAERRWLALAKDSMKKSTKWLVIDEPESGIHRTAEADLAVALASPVWNSGNVLVIATHSPEFIEIANANVLHIEAGIVRELTSLNRENLEILGLRPSDLLTSVKVFLLVEGEHEKIVFETLFKEELRKLRCKIIVARGGKNMKDVFESQMIFDFSDALVICLLDNLNAEAIEAIWDEARNLSSKGKVIEAGQYVRSALPGSKSGENVFLSQFLTLALANGQHERIAVWGLTKEDIVLYLPPIEFGIKRSWEELLTQHSKDDGNFKAWACKKYDANFSLEGVRRATKALDTIPNDFGNLMMKIASVIEGR
jgi:AAA15 family ATPase/GTPase